MTETQLKIIELIEPHMDKEWGKWCLWQFEDETIMEMSWLEDKQDIHDTLEWTNTKIIGHYDITAVLKYIYKQKTKIYISLNVIRVHYWPDMKSEIEIPHKPINLYTDKENEELLKLLLKLK